MGIGTVKDLREAKLWYKRAQEHGDRRAGQRIGALDRIPNGRFTQERAPAPAPVSAPPPAARASAAAGPSANRNFDPRLSQWMGDAASPADRRRQAGFPVAPPQMNGSSSRPQSMMPDSNGYPQGNMRGPPPPNMPVNSPPLSASMHSPMQGLVPQPQMRVVNNQYYGSPREKEDARLEQRLSLLHKQPPGMRGPQNYQMAQPPQGRPAATHSPSTQGETKKGWFK